MAKIIIFGTQDIAQLANFYFTSDSKHEVVAFAVNEKYLKIKEFEGKPVVAFETIIETYPPSAYMMFVAMSYKNLNKLRTEKYLEAKAKGYQLVSYVSSACTFLSSFDVGDNSLILENNTIQPYVKIGSNVIIWSGNHIGHHSVIDDHSFISSHVVISGRCHIKSGCFLGVNSTIANNIVIEKNCIIGSGAVITAGTEEDAVYVPPKTVKLNKKSFEINL
jgi:sugar O-acyltransferase (sialic acid O-acetyltransferase NeuD family)